MGSDTKTEELAARAYQLIASGRLIEAESACRQLAMEYAPRWPVGWFLLGLTHLRKGVWAEAEAALKEAVLLDGNRGEYWHNLSTALEEQGRFTEAEESSKRAIQVDRLNPDNWFGLGLAYYGQQKWHEASTAFREAVSRNPRDAGAWCNLGIVEHQLARFGSAKQAYEQGLAYDPEHVDIQVNYAYLLAVMGDVERASAIYRLVLARDPQQPEALYNFALILLLNGALTEAQQLSERLVSIDANAARGWSLLGAVLMAVGHHEDGLKAYERSLQLGQQAIDHSKLLLALQYCDNVSPRDHLQAHEKWNAIYARPLTARHVPSNSGAAGKLRIGLVSADFNQHPIAFLTLPALEHLDRNRCSITLYHDRVVEDEFTARFQRTADRWRTTIGLSDDDLAKQIQDDQIDVLVDLMGHTGKRLLAFARKPAPMQVTWLGYVGTTGLSSMDFILADRYHIPAGEELYYVEQVLRMPDDYACYGPPTYAPGVAEPPALKNGFVTFGCFNNPTKYGHAVVKAWSALLNAIPTARLLLKYRGLDSRTAREQYGKRLEERGIPLSRVDFEGHSPHRELLTAYSRIDIALDTQPYSGGVTTCEALWMGVPVITFPGATFAGRHSTSHLNNAGYAMFVAEDAAGYVDLAVRWAQRLDELEVVRREMRDRVRQSPLCNPGRFANDFLATLCQAWESKQIAR